MTGDLRRRQSRRRPLARALRGLELALLLAGSALIGTWVLARAERSAVEAYEGWRLDQRVERRSHAGTGGSHAASRSAAVSGPAQAREGTHPRGAHRPVHRRLVGRILIPRLHLSAIVLEGVDDGTLLVAVGHVPGTALPGQKGNAALAAHRDSFFRPLAHVRPGDLIVVIRPLGTSDYRVVGTRVVSPDDLDVIRPTPEPTLTLLTCYPFAYIGPAPERFVVHAVLTHAADESSPDAAARTQVATRTSGPPSPNSSGSAPPSLRDGRRSGRPHG
ncbi:MAG: class D sortase [Acidobacteriota bacterium]